MTNWFRQHNPIDWMRAHKPHRLSEWVMPYLVVVLTITTIASGTGAIEAVRTSDETAKLAKQTAVLSEENTRDAEVAKALARGLQQGLIEGCRKNGNSLRRLLRERTQDEISSPAKTAELEALFPNTPKDKLDAAIAKNDRKLRKEVRELAPVPCAQQYRSRPRAGEVTPGAAADGN